MLTGSGWLLELNPTPPLPISAQIIKIEILILKTENRILNNCPNALNIDLRNNFINQIARKSHVTSNNDRYVED